MADAPRVQNLRLREVAIGWRRMADSAWPFFVLGLFATIQLARFMGPEYAIDDAWITFRFARNLVETGTPSLNAGGEWVEGVSNPLWTLLSAAMFGLTGSDPVGLMRLLGGLLWLAACGWLVAGVYRMGQPPRVSTRLAAVACGAVLAASGSSAFHAVSGLETGLWALASAVGIVGMADARTRQRGATRQLALASVLAVWTRPEGLLLGGLLSFSAILLLPRRQAWKVAAAWLGGCSSLLAVRWMLYGELLPNTFWAKPPDPAMGAWQAVEFLAQGLGVVGLAVFTLMPHRRAYTALSLAAAVMLLGTVWSGGDWMPGYRRFTFCYMAFAFMVGAAVAEEHRVARRIGVAALSACLVGNLYAAFSMNDHQRTNPEAMQAIAQRLDAAHFPRVALLDVGRFGWEYRGHIVDLGALNDRVLARSPGPHLAKWDAEWFEAQAPDAALCFMEVESPDAQLFDGSPFRPRSIVESRLFEYLDGHPNYRVDQLLQYAKKTWVVVFSRQRPIN